MEIVIRGTTDELNALTDAALERERVKLKTGPAEIALDGKALVRAMFPDVAGAIHGTPPDTQE